MKTIEENNRLIAEFMGFEIIDRPYGNGFVTLSETEICDVDDLLYHTSWDWLMPVVDKINSLNGGEFNTVIISNACRIYSDKNTYNEIIEANSTIEATYKSILKLIEWYNK